MIEDRNLTPNFTLYQFTRTDRAEFQDRNRDVTEGQIKKLTDLALLMEAVRIALELPTIKINSAYRYPDLNKAVGSTDRSQHLLCEAADFTPGEQDLGEAFRAIWRLVKDGKLSVGQLIYETAERYSGPVSWIHISLGEPYRAKERCAQILRMEGGKYTRLA